jgi:hypothetical protein
MMARLIAIVLGFGMILVGIAGLFVPAPAEVRQSMPHNWLHLTLGSIALSFGLLASRRAVVVFDLFFGGLHLLLAFFGWTMGQPANAATRADPRVLVLVPEELELGSVDHFFHLVVGILFVGGALLSRRLLVGTRAPHRGKGAAP